MKKFALIVALFAALAAGAADTTLNGPIVPSGGVSWPSGSVGTSVSTFTLALDPNVAPTITVYNNGAAPVYCSSGPSTVTVTASKWSAVIPPAATNGAAGWASWQDSTKPTTVACVSTAAGNGVIITQSLGAPVASRGGGGGGGGGGAVNSVGASGPLTSSGGTNPVISVANTSPNQILAGPTSGGAQGAVTARSLVGADLPVPTTSALGGVKANAGTTGQFVSGIASDGSLTYATPSGSVNLSSPNGTLAIAGTAPNYTLDLAQQSATSGQVLAWNGTKFAPATPAASGVATVTGNIVGGTAANPVVTQVQPDWNASTGLGVVLNKPTVLGSGSIAAIADQEIALNVGGSAGGYPVNAVIDPTTSSVTINSNLVTITNSLNSAATTVSALTGQVNPVLNTQYTPLAAYSKLGVGAFGSGGTLTVTNYSYSSATQVVATLNGTAAQVSAIFNDSAGAPVKSSTVFAGPSTFGTFAFKPGPAAAIAALAPGVSLTTTGVTGAATLTSGVLNVPQYTRSPNANSNHVSGTNAGNALTTGTYDTVFGSFAGQNISSGGYNTFIGNGAGELSTTPSFNTFVGAIAGTSNSTGEKNACLGYRCLYSNTTARGVSSIGSWAGDGQSNRVVLSDGDAQIAFYSKTPISGGDQTTYTLLNGRTAQSSGGSLEVPGSIVFQPPTTEPTLGTNLDAAIWLNGAVPTLKQRDASGTSTNYPLSGGGAGGAAGSTSVSWVQSATASSPYVINSGQVAGAMIMPVSVAVSTNLYSASTGNGTIAGTRYIGAQATVQSGYSSALQFPTSLPSGGYTTDFRLSIPSMTTRVVMANSNIPSGASVYVGIGKASAIAARADPLNDANVLPWFDVPGNDPNPFAVLVKPTVTVAAVSGQTNTFDITVAGGMWFGGGTAPAYTGTTTDWLPFISITPTGSPSVAISSVTSASTTNFNMVTALGLQGASGGGGTVPSMQAANNAGNTISNVNGGQGSTTWSSGASTNYTTVQGSSIRTARVDFVDGSGSNTVSVAGPVPNASYRIILPPDAPTATNQVMSVSTITGQNYATAWTSGSARQLCVFRVAETSSASGAQLFTVGTRGGSVTSSVTGCGVTAPASGTSNWSFPAGNYLITANIDYTAIGNALQTVITNFGIGSTVSGGGGAQVLYSVGSKNQPAGDDISTVGMQFMNFQSTSNLYLTRYTSSSAGSSSAQITASGNSQLIIEKLP